MSYYDKYRQLKIKVSLLLTTWWRNLASTWTLGSPRPKTSNQTRKFSFLLSTGISVNWFLIDTDASVNQPQENRRSTLTDQYCLEILFQITSCEKEQTDIGQLFDFKISLVCKKCLNHTLNLSWNGVDQQIFSTPVILRNEQFLNQRKRKMMWHGTAFVVRQRINCWVLHLLALRTYINYLNIFWGHFVLLVRNSYIKE